MKWENKINCSNSGICELSGKKFEQGCCLKKNVILTLK